jgi:hypothetical protein
MTLSKSLRAALKEQNWDATMKHRQNQAETRSDVIANMKRDMQDLALLAYRAPDDMLERVYTPDKISEFLGAVLYHEGEDDAAIKALAAEVNRLRQPLTEIQTILDRDSSKRNKLRKLSAGKRQRLQHEKERLEADIPWRPVDEELARLIRRVDLRRSRIARVLLELGTRYLIDQYSNLEQELPIRNNVTTTMLQSLQLSNSVVNKVADITESSGLKKRKK